MPQMIIALILGTWLISVGVAVSTGTRPCKIGPVNGCSVPPGISVRYTDEFTVACDRHDVCYSCGSDKKYSMSRGRCDDLFRSNMLKICQGQNSTDCMDYAELFYSAVRGFGASHYHRIPSRWCIGNSVPECINGSV